ncbi:polymorphic toxin type 8 domain-containing protein [Paenibacillus sp. PCH8]|uniref:polymorphic toxin type 8 domain-containing protein n=1 Tax=Paenibacillus sp. PCH8 TaxID=2066524 RepID=UPI0015E46974|nr:polymorphic toxin type 8 domain-containing protein [Paenibacillus sp. PCH8]
MTLGWIRTERNYQRAPLSQRSLNTTSQTAYNNDHEFKVEMNKKHSTTDDLVEIKEDKFSIGLNPVAETNPVKTTQSLSSTKPAGIVKNNVMTYKGLYPDTDLIYTLGNDRLKEELKLSKKPTGKKSVIYSFALTLGNLDYRQKQDGSVSLINPSNGHIEYIIDKPLMYDSFIPEGYQQAEGVNAYPEESLSYDIHYELKEKNGQLYIDVIPSLAWLNDASRVYPVTIDPTIVKFQPTYRLADTNIRSAFPKQTGATDTTLGVGLYKDATSSNVIRSLIQFDTSTIPQGAKVLTADLNLWLASVSNNTNVDITLNSVNKAWTEYSAYTPSAGEYLTLKKVKSSAGATTGYELTDKHGYLMHFDTVSNDDQVSITQAKLSYEQDMHGNRITYKRNGNGALTGIEDPSGRTITFEYTSDGLVDYPMLEGRKTDYTYQNGKLVTVDQYSEDGTYSRTQFSYGGNYIKTIFDPNNRLTTYTYDQEYLVKVQEPSTVSVTDASDRPATQYKYDTTARTADITNANGHTTNYTLNSNFVAEKIQNAKGEITQYVLDANYNVKKVTNPDGTVAEQTYDSKGNVLTQTDEVGNVTTYEYNGLNHVVKEIDPRQNITNYSYTAAGDLETIVDAKQKVTRYEYDTYGNLKKTTYPDQSIETYSYEDKGNNIKSVIDAAGNTTTVTTDTIGNMIANTDGNNNRTDYHYDKLNRLKAVIDPKRKETTYEYDTAGNLTKTINPKQAVVQYEYNGQNQLTKKTDAIGNVTDNKYDSNGNIIETTTPNGNTISTTFTALDQLKTISIDGQQKWAYEYNENGLLVNVNNGARSFTYKSDGLPETEVDRGHQKSYIYNANSGLQELSYATGGHSSTVSYDYTELDQVKSISKDNQNLISYQYNDMAAMEQADRANGILTKADYDTGEQLRTYGDYSSTGSVIREYDYTYDSNENVKTIHSELGDTTYEYDALNQLEQETLPDGTTIKYRYDDVGNRTQKVVVTNGQEQTTVYEHNNANQLTTVNGQDYLYDNNGNLLNDGKQTYIYDALDQLIEVQDQSGQKIQHYSYDENGRRIQSTGQSGTVNFFYDGDEVIYETDENNKTLREYTWDDSGSPVAMTKDGLTYYYHLNGHGDVVSLTDQAGNEVAQYEYDAWGNIVNQSGSLADENPYRYASYRYNAETGLYYLISRNYNPQLGSFISLDSEQDLDLDNPLNRNGYSYGLNNPVVYVDDDGNNPFIIYFVIFVVKVVVKEVVKTGVKKTAKKATVKAIKKGTSSAAAKKTGRSGKQARLKEIANDAKVSTSLRGEIKRDLNEIKRKKRKNVRVPQGYQMQHKSGFEARKGYGYEHSVLNITKNHKTQHRYDNNGKIR